MLTTATVPEIRAAEQPLLDAGVPLMDQAAHAVSDAVLADGFVPGAAVDLLVGAGNNGGDALWAGKYLQDAGLRVTAYLVGDTVYGPGLAALRAAGGNVVIVGAAKAVPTPADGLGAPARPDPQLPVVVAAAQLATADVLIDGLLGIGATGLMRGIAGDLVTALNESLKQPPPLGRRRPWVMAVDSPSGVVLDGDGAGQVPGPALAANHTITFGAPKPGLLLPPAAHLVGKLTVANLGMTVPTQTNAPSQVTVSTQPTMPSQVNPGSPNPLSSEHPTNAAGSSPSVSPAVHRLVADDVAALWAVPTAADQKYTRGVVGVIAGTQKYPGAAVLATSAAANSGAGMVRYLGPDDVAKQVIAANPEVVAGGGQVQAWVCGSGVPTTLSGDPDDGQRERIRAALSGAIGTLAGVGGKVPVVVDAGALEMLPARVPPWVVLTPHSGELAVLLTSRGHRTSRAQVDADPLAATRLAQQLTGATVLLKGNTTVVVGPNPVNPQQGQLVFSQADAPAWLATAGAGDVLAGLLGTMLAQHSAAVVADPTLAARIAAAAALVHGQAAAQVNPGGPITASAVARELPPTIARILTSTA